MAPMVGAFFLLIAFVATVASVISAALGVFVKKEIGGTFAWASRIAAILGFVALTVCCGVLLYCFIIGDYSIQYVLDERPSTDSLLFKIAGLWAGREGSLLFWAWLISLFNMIISVRRMNDLDEMDNAAILIGQLVLLAFVSVLLFSDANMPFTATDSKYYDSNGYLNSSASALGMNALLEHWAMAIHPPTLFVGYAGLTIPFAYAIAALIVNDPSKKWVFRSERFALVAWLFLTIGIGLGSLWAYVCLGWGGYWGWDPVENASLLPWLVCVSLMHSFSQYKRRGQFKCWTVICASLAFAFCIVGTFISRSGLVQSVHAFEGDPVSLALFGVLILVSFLMGVIGCLIRRKTFAAPAGDDMQSMFSREGAYFLNNVVMIVMAVVLAYLTIAQALPSFLPFGGTSVSSGTYDSIARPIGILFLLLMAVCPLLGWGKTNPKAFWRRARVPGICAIVLFVILLIFFIVKLLPVYNSIIAAGGSAASELSSAGPAFYYNGLAVVGFAVAALLLFNSFFKIPGIVKAKAPLRAKMPALGSSISHLAMAFILVGLIGSNMYVTEKTGYISYDSDKDVATENFEIGDYTLNFTGSDITSTSNQKNIEYKVAFDVLSSGNKLGHVDSSVMLVTTTQQRKYNAGVLGLPTEDVFVVYQGVRESDGALSVDVRINPLVGVVWVGFFLLCIGMAIAIFGKRKGAVNALAPEPDAEGEPPVPEGAEAKRAESDETEPKESESKAETE